jgi:hypothetical protein
MAAITRFVSYEISSSGVAGTGRGAGCKGTRGYSIGTADPGDDITVGPTTDRLYFSFDGDGSPPAAYITLYSGSALDPRFVAKDISEKIHALSSDERYANMICSWENVTVAGGATNCNRLVIRSGSLGSSSSVTITSGTNSAHLVLGYGTKVETGGAATPDGKAAYTFAGTVSVSGTYYGLFDEVYKIVISNDNGAIRGIGTPTKDGSNTYAGVMTTGGVFNHTGDLQYVMAIDVTNGTTMGAGTGNVPRMSWTSTGSADDSTAYTELLYPNYWYLVGTKGFMVKFTDAVFNTCSPAWTAQCYKPDYAQGTNASAAVGVAEYIWSSTRGDMSGVSRGTTVSGGYTALGTRGLYVRFDSGAGTNLGAGDCYYVLCKGVQPSGYNITSLNYGNVTVSTESSVKSVMFEIESGAAELSTVKFGLQSHGTFVHHNAGNNDTYFRFGTVGPANLPVSSGIEWYPNVTAADIDADIPPSYLYATNDNLAVVATADLSESVGSYPLRGMTSDPMWLNIRLGASETGANSTINYRTYFDFA